MFKSITKNCAILAAVFALSSQATEIEAAVEIEAESGAEFVPEFTPAVKAFNTNTNVFDQKSYDETVSATAEMMISLEALRKDVTKIQKEMAEIEDIVYGHSKDAHDKQGEVDANGHSVDGNRHTMLGIHDRTIDLADRCRYS